MLDSLWGEDFTPKEKKKKEKKILNKVDKPKVIKQVTTKNIKSTKLSISEKLKFIAEEVARILGVYKENTIIIKTKEQLHEYISKAIENKEIAIDTETDNSLDPLTCKLMGPCIYTPGQKNAYIPLNHVNIDTQERLDWQLTESDIKEEFDRLDDTTIIMHNGKFDYQVIKCTTGKQLKVYWDTMLAARLLDENEKAGLKEQYISKIDPSIERYTIEHLFQSIPYAFVDPELFALYAATDAYMTYKLYEWQKKQFELLENKKLYDLFLNIEMPIMEVAAEMELTGVIIDKEYASRLSAKYNNKLLDLDKKLNKIIEEKYSDIIKEWRKTPEANFHPKKKNSEEDAKSKNEQLEDPINLASPLQLAIFLYDVLKIKPVDKKAPRGTGEEILEKLDFDFCKLVLERRGLVKLINTYIDKLPQCVNEKTGRLHAHFNQLGAGTGRFSSSEPNLQNIPSHEKSIRLMFTAGEGNVMVGSDFSQQEPRLLSQYSQDENMINAYRAGKDLYATIACGVYNNTYWDNMEHHEDGTANPDGKKRRSAMKSLLLGIMYQRGAASIAEELSISMQEAQKIIDDFYKGFPKVKNYITSTQEFCKKTGYVEDLWGRRRRLPDILLPKYKIIDKNNTVGDFNPLIGSKNILSSIENPLISKYNKQLNNVKNRKDYEAIKEKALKENIEIHDNSGFIASAERQCVNARIQGGAATMTKIAMIKIYNDQQLKDLGFKLLLAVHDELIGECPEINKNAVAERLTYVMKTCVDDICSVPFKCDADISTCWYLNDYQDVIRNDFTKLLEHKVDEKVAFNELCEKYSESTIEQMEETLHELLSKVN